MNEDYIWSSRLLNGFLVWDYLLFNSFMITCYLPWKRWVRREIIYRTNSSFPCQVVQTESPSREDADFSAPVLRENWCYHSCLPTFVTNFYLFYLSRSESESCCGSESCYASAFHGWLNSFFSVFNIPFESNASITPKENVLYTQ